MRAKNVEPLSVYLVQEGVPENVVQKAVGEFYPAADKRFGEYGIVQHYWTPRQLAGAMARQEADRGDGKQAQAWLDRAGSCLEGDHVRVKTATAFILASRLHFAKR
jgi:hypothetical protein